MARKCQKWEWDSLNAWPVEALLSWGYEPSESRLSTLLQSTFCIFIIAYFPCIITSIYGQRYLWTEVPKSLRSMCICMILATWRKLVLTPDLTTRIIVMDVWYFCTKNVVRKIPEESLHFAFCQSESTWSHISETFDAHFRKILVILLTKEWRWSKRSCNTCKYAHRSLETSQFEFTHRRRKSSKRNWRAA